MGSLLCRITVVAGVFASWPVSAQPHRPAVTPRSGLGNAVRRAAPSPPASSPTRVAQLRDHDVPPDGYMMVAAYRGTDELDRWSGAVDHRVSEPTRYAATRTRAGRWRWEPRPPGPLRLNAPARHDRDGGQLIHDWARKQGATGVLVIVVPHPGEPDEDASRTGMDVRGEGRGRTRASRNTTQRVVRPTVEQRRAPRTNLDTQSEMSPRVAVAEEIATGQGQDGDGPGLGRGTSRSVRGTGTHASGSKRGSSLGSESPSWVDNPRAEIAIRGGRTPADGGRAGGSAGGKKGATGNVGGSGWLNLLDAPESVAPAVAAALIVFEADVMGFGQRLFSRAVRGLAGKTINTEIGRQARAVVRRRAQVARARMQKARPDAPPAEHLDEIMDYMPVEVEAAFYRDLAGLARKRLHVYSTTRASTKGATDEASRWAHKLAVENQTAWRKIEQACEQRLRAVKSASAPQQPTGATSTTSATRPASTSSTGTASGATPGASVRTSTAASTPASTISRGGGLGPVLKGLRGEARVRAVYNIGPRKMIRINGRRRIPDGVTKTVLTEVKNVKKLSFTGQLRDYLDISRKFGLDFDLFVRRDTKLTKPLVEAINNRLINLRYIP